MKNIIMKRMQCTAEKAEIIEKKLNNICDILKPLLEKWLETGEELDDTKFEGYSINDLINGYDMYFTGALLTLDWLIKDPETAKKALKSGIK